MNALLTAILDDDRPRVRELLKADPRLATCLIGEARLCQSKIFHWIYAGDTALHLAVQSHGRGGSGAEAAKAAQRQIIQEFLAFGLNPALKDSKGKSVIDCARSSWIRDILVRV